MIKEKGRISHCFDPILLNIITKQTTKDKSIQGSIKNGFGLMLLQYCGFQMKVLLINELKWSFIKQTTKDKNNQGSIKNGFGLLLLKY